MKKLNTFFCGFITSALIFSSISIVSAKTEKIEALFENIKIKVNGKLIDTGDDKPFIYNGRTYVPARYVAQELNATVKWNETENTVEIDSILSPELTPTPNPSIPSSPNAPVPTPPVGRDQGLQKNLKTPDGLDVYNYAGLGIMLSDVLNKYPNITYTQKNNKISVGDNELVNVYVAFYRDNRYIPYDHYVDIVLPLLK